MYWNKEAIWTYLKEEEEDFVMTKSLNVRVKNKPKIMEASKAESTGFDATEKLNCLQQNIQDFT